MNRSHPPGPRSLARQLAFQILYQQEANPPGMCAAGDDDRLGEIAREVYQSTCEDQRDEAPTGSPPASATPLQPETIAFIRSLIRGVHQYRSELDARLAEAAHHWRVERMASTDRTVLRLAAFEILHTDTPGPVVLDEAIELAKRFGSAQSGPFVNGVLDRILRDQTGPPSIAPEPIRLPAAGSPAAGQRPPESPQP